MSSVEDYDKVWFYDKIKFSKKITFIKLWFKGVINDYTH